MAKVKRNYVNNKTLYEEMIKYKDKLKFAEEMGKVPPSVPNYVGQCFLQICNRLSTKPNFMNYSYRDEMVADAIENCVSAAHSFDPEKSSNPFAYFTQIAWNAFIRRIHKEKKQAYIKHKNFVNSNLMEDISREMSTTSQPFHNEYSDDIIRNFENKLVKNTKKAKIGLEKFVEEEKNEELTPSTS